MLTLAGGLLPEDVYLHKAISACMLSEPHFFPLCANGAEISIVLPDISTFLSIH